MSTNNCDILQLPSRSPSTYANATMGCVGSKTTDPGDKEALQRNAKIDKILKGDKKTMDRTIKILLLGTFLRHPYWIWC